MPGRIREIMTSEVETVAPTDPVATLVARMRERVLSCLIVCEAQRPVGVVSERDVVRLYADNRCHAETVAEIMSSPPVTIRVGATTGEAMRLTRERGIRRLVVVDEAGGLAGLVTQTDLLHAHALEVERHKHDLEREVAERTRELAEANARLQALALMDSMLEIGNRRAMEQALDRAQDQAERYGLRYAVALFDVDHFKTYNDRYGHPEADVVLRRVAQALARQLRTADALFRYGGEEMLALMPETPLAGALRASDRARAAVEGLGVEHAGSAHGVVTVSVGVAVAPSDVAGWRDVIEAADQALYRAKQAGRNRSEAAPTPEARGS